MSENRNDASASIELHRALGQSLPLVVYRGALLPPSATAEAFAALFERHRWGGGWQNGIYPYHHFHATTHEVLGIARGGAKVRFGGDDGPLVEVGAGDVIVIPAGVSHRNEGSSADLLVVGAYPEAREPDMKRGLINEHSVAAAKVAEVPIPAMDPVFGDDGPLLRHWSKAPGVRG